MDYIALTSYVGDENIRFFQQHDKDTKLSNTTGSSHISPMHVNLPARVGNNKFSV